MAQPTPLFVGLDVHKDSIALAPALIPKRPGDKVKTDRRDAVELARWTSPSLPPAFGIPMSMNDSEYHDRVRDDAKEHPDF